MKTTMEITCRNLVENPKFKQFGKIFDCKQKNRVSLISKPASGKAFCGKCGQCIATYKGTDHVYRIIPRRAPNTKRKSAEFYM